MDKDNNKKYKQLRGKYDFFIYRGFSITDTQTSIMVVYHFNLADRYEFFPTLKIRKKNFVNDKLAFSDIENFVFHIGLIELISYWKAACPPRIIVKPFKLNEKQIDWWKKLYFNGLGEFFYLNGIKNTIENFVEIISDSEKEIGFTKCDFENNKVLVPVGGGKDSIVTLELLKNKYNVIPFILNPRQASLETIKVAGFQTDEFLEIIRTIDPQLLVLNNMGFLNGHTPFSALLAFVSVFSSALTASRHIALSNEASANEPTEKKSGVNHQYSKSFEFEKDFREYVSEFISQDINYFSFLRPLSEYNIAALFSTFPKYFNVFKSCNVGSKKNIWCGKCPKCLFTYIILSPFIRNERLVNIFGKDLYRDKEQLTHFNELTGISEVKPFECVGTVYEVNIAIIQAIEKHQGQLPYLLEYYRTLLTSNQQPATGNQQPATGNRQPATSNQQPATRNQKEETILMFEDNHFLTKDFLNILKSYECVIIKMAK